MLLFLIQFYRYIGLAMTDQDLKLNFGGYPFMVAFCSLGLHLLKLSRVISALAIIYNKRSLFYKILMSGLKKLGGAEIRTLYSVGVALSVLLQIRESPRSYQPTTHDANAERHFRSYMH